MQKKNTNYIQYTVLTNGRADHLVLALNLLPHDLVHGVAGNHVDDAHLLGGLAEAVDAVLRLQHHAYMKQTYNENETII